MPRQHLLIVYHSQSGTTEAMAQAVIRGARDPAIEGVEVRVRAALDAGPGDLLWADGVILGTPENFGYMSGGLKTFLDRSYHACLEDTQGLPWALFVRAGNDGQGAVSSVERIVAGLRWKAIQAPLVVAGPADEAAVLPACEELGLTMAAGLEAGVF
ncbi:MAG: flavodoxin family protein [Gammaproteobacteria bacterium]|nr:flavodoxin family protein [Gammaproteobacteria bacterium]TVQ48598.1 MAG: flavodoxin family protein [Gammaproteobacteria bacterium]